MQGRCCGGKIKIKIKVKKGNKLIVEEQEGSGVRKTLYP